MAPLRCPQCRREVSRAMGACPECGHAFPGPSSGSDETVPPPPTKRRSRVPAVLLAVLAVPGFVVNPILGAVLAVAALNVWTNLAKRPVGGRPDGARRRKGRRWIVGALSVAVVLVTAGVVWVLRIEDGIEDHLFHSWRRHVEARGGERASDLLIRGDDTFTFEEEGDYRFRSETTWSWEADGAGYELAWTEFETGDWKLSGDRLTTKARRNESGDARLRIDGVRADPNARIPFSGGRMTAAALKEHATAVRVESREMRVLGIDSRRLVLLMPLKPDAEPVDITWIRLDRAEEPRALGQSSGSE